MLTTQVNITLIGGNGGNGKVSFRKSKKGPDGGNGGDGGNIYISATTDIYALADLAKVTKIKANDGEDGMATRKTGQSAGDLEIKLPIGAVITDKDTGEAFEVIKKDDRFLICRGGKGGLGNWEFRSSTNTTPMYAQKGHSGQLREVSINLKLIADCGLIGFPNAGKSSLLKELTAAKPKIAAYPFTTLEPNLGELNGKIIADIPGLIEGASKGKGLGVDFLKHIERVSLLLHCVSCESDDPKRDYLAIRNELEAYNQKLLDIPEVILLTKSDLISKAEIKTKTGALKKFKKQILPVSIHDWQGLEKLKALISSSFSE